MGKLTGLCTALLAAALIALPGAAFALEDIAIDEEDPAIVEMAEVSEDAVVAEEADSSVVDEEVPPEMSQGMSIPDDSPAPMPEEEPIDDPEIPIEPEPEVAPPADPETALEEPAASPEVVEEPASTLKPADTTLAAQATAKPAQASKKRITSAVSANAIYSGKKLTPKLVVKSGSKKLKLGRDYTVKYKNNKKVGKATIVIRGIGAYAGTKTIRFRIYGKPEYTVCASKMPVYATSAWKLKNATIKVVSGKKVVKLSGKTVTALKAGTAKIRVYNKLGKKVKTRSITVYKFYGSVYLKIGTDTAAYLEATGEGRPTLQAKTGKDEQRFTFTAMDKAGYRITGVASGKALAPERVDGAYTTRLAQLEPSTAKAQRWQVKVDSTNKLTFVNAATGKALSVAKGKDAAGATVSLRKASTAGNTSFAPKVPAASCVVGASMMPVDATSPWTLKNCKLIVSGCKDVISFKDGIMRGLKKGTASVSVVDAIGRVKAAGDIQVYKLSSTYYLSSALAPGRVVDIDAWLTENGGNIILWDSTGYVNQKYHFKHQADGSYKIRSDYSGNVLQQSNGEGSVKNNVEQWESNSSDYQRWYIQVGADNMLTFVNKASGLTMALKKGKTKLGTSIVVTDAPVEGAQKFTAHDLNQKVMKGKYNLLALYACWYSYSQPVYYQNKAANTGTELYKRICKAIFPGYVAMSCDRGVASAARWSGVDIDMPASCSKQYPYMYKSDDWEYLGHWSGNEADLKPGDVLIRTTGMKEKSKGTTSNHVCVYVGLSTALAVYNSYIKGTDGDKGTPTSDATFVSAHKSPTNKKNACAACIGNAKYAHADTRMVVFRLKRADNSIKYSYLK